MSDAREYFECQHDAQAERGLMEPPRNLQEARKEIKRFLYDMRKRKPRGETFAIEIREKFVGYVMLRDINRKYREHIAEIGYCLNKKFRNKGIMTSAVKIIIDYAFRKYKLKRVEGKCRTFNKASARVLEKAGLKFEGILRKNKCKNGKYLDDMIFAKIR